MSLTFITNPEDAEYPQGSVPSALTATATADSGIVDYIWQYSSDQSSWTNVYSGLFDITDGTNEIVDDQGAAIEGYDTTFEDAASLLPDTSSLGTIYYRCRARKTASRGIEEFAYSNIATIIISQATVPVILSFTYSKNPCETGEAILITASVTEA